MNLGQNSIIYVPGPSNLLTPKEIEQSSESIFSGCKLFVSTFECTPSTLQTALSIAKKKSGKRNHLIIIVESIIFLTRRTKRLFKV